MLPTRTIAALGLLCLSACGQQTTTATPTPAAQKPDLTAALDNQPQGLARLAADARSGGRLTVHLDITGLAPNSVHAVHLHGGSCLARTGTPEVSFGAARADAHGVITADLPATTDVGAIPAASYLDLHPAGDAAAVPLLCADVPATAATNTIRLYATPGYKPYGTVSLSYVTAARKLTVVVAISALTPGSTDVVDVASGTCAAPTAIIGSTPPVAADSDGNLRLTHVLTSINLTPPVSGWIAIVRDTAQQPVLCGAFKKP